MNIDKKTLRLMPLRTERGSTAERFIMTLKKPLKRRCYNCFKLREKNMSTDDFINSAKEIKLLCEKYNVPLIIKRQCGRGKSG